MVEEEKTIEERIMPIVNSLEVLTDDPAFSPYKDTLNRVIPLLANIPGHAAERANSEWKRAKEYDGLPRAGSQRSANLGVLVASFDGDTFTRSNVMTYFNQQIQDGKIVRGSPVYEAFRSLIKNKGLTPLYRGGQLERVPNRRDGATFRVVEGARTDLRELAAQ